MRERGRPKTAVTTSRNQAAIPNVTERHMNQNESRQGATETMVLENDSVYATLCNKINLKPVAEARPLEAFRDNDALSEASADERVARGMDALLNLIAKESKPVDRLDKSLLDFYIGQLDRQIGRQLDAVMHAPDFQALEGRWRGLKMLVSRTDFRKNARIEVLDVSKEALASWDKQWAKSDLQPLKAEVAHDPPDLMAFDAWLDRINQTRDQEARLLVFVRLNPVLQALPPDGSAEAGVALLVVPEPMQRRFKIDSIARLHRPNDTDNCPSDVALARTLRWGRMEPSALSRIWQCALDPAATNAVTAAAVKAGIAAKVANIDYMVGHAGEVASWLGAACAAKAVARDGTPQLLATTGKTGVCFSVLRNGDPQ